MAIGYSLSLCVTDIINGVVDEKDVKKIIAATAAENEADWVRVLTTYSNAHWSRAPIQGVMIATRLIDKGLIEQPRLEGKDAPNLSCRYWWSEING